MQQNRQDELRDELVAILGAGRELNPDTDRQLAEAFLRSLNEPAVPARRAPVEAEHQPHFSLVATGVAWGAAAMFLILLAAIGDPTPFGMLSAIVLVLGAVFLATRGFLYVTRTYVRAPLQPRHERRHDVG